MAPNISVNNDQNIAPMASMSTPSKLSQVENSDPGAMTLTAMMGSYDTQVGLLQSKMNEVKDRNSKIADLTTVMKNVRDVQGQFKSGDDPDKTIQLTPQLKQQLTSTLGAGSVPADGKVTAAQLTNINSSLSDVQSNLGNQSQQDQLALQINVQRMNASMQAISNIMQGLNQTNQNTIANFK